MSAEAPQVGALSKRERWLHVFGLWGFAVMAPLLTFLGGESQFWVARRVTWLDVTFYTGVLLSIPLVITLIQLMLLRRSALAANVVHGLFIVSALFLIALPFIDRVLGMTVRVRWMAVITGLLAVGITWIYWRWKPLRGGFGVLALAPLVFGGVFAFQLPSLAEPDLESVSIQGAQTDISVVLVVLDELPAGSLLDGDGEIDDGRFPNFARLASGSTHYRNAYTPSDFTLTGIPAIVTGKLPRDGTLPTVADHPENLFTLLADTHHMEVDESVTRLCPVSLCGHRESLVSRVSLLLIDSAVIWAHAVVPAGAKPHLPPIGNAWQGFITDRSALISGAKGPNASALAQVTGQEFRSVAFGRFVDSFSVSEEPTLYFLHIEFPHAPWEYGPDGSRYALADWIPGLESGVRWESNEWQVLQAYQRYDAQLQYTDYLLGLMLDELEVTGLWDSSIVIVTSDHGINFETEEPKRGATRETVGSIAPIPLFIHYPGQTVGSVEDRPARTIDIVPTVIDVLGGAPGTLMDGRSLLDSEGWPVINDTLSIGGTTLTYGEIAEAAAADALRLSGLRGIRDYDGWFAAGPYPGLYGSPVTDLRIVKGPGGFELAEPELYVDYEPGSSPSPMMVRTELTRDAGDLFAVAVNGTIWGTGSRSGDYVSILVPAWVFDATGSVVEVFGLTDSGVDVSLVRFGG